MAETARPPRSLRLGGTSYPVVLPSLRDPRLHLAAVIVSLQVLGQTVLQFQLSIAQILLSLATCAVIELAYVFWRRRIIAWPASALLTGNSVAFILRVPGTQSGDWWSLHGAWLFVLAATLSLASKYVIRVGDRHVFNPSNLGLVACFLLFGSLRTNPQDLWWGPQSPGLALTLAVIVAGGLVIVGRLRMLPMVVAFAAGFALLVGVVAGTGHCITARWHYGPICGQSFWLTLVTSPETMVFTFFMMTDPQTAPAGRVARVVFGLGLALASTLLIAPQTTEFATKVALLGGLVLVCGARLATDRLLPAAGSERDGLAAWPASWSLPGRPAGLRSGAAGRLAPPAAVVLAVVGLGAGSVLAAALPARPGPAPHPRPTPAVARPEVVLDPAQVPPVVVEPGVARFDPMLTPATAAAMERDLIADLEILGDAARRGDASLATTAATGSYLHAFRQALMGAGQSSSATGPGYSFDAAEVVLVRDPAQPQGPPAIGVRLRGVERQVTPAPAGGSRPAPFDRVLGLERVGGHYLIASDLTGRPLG